MRHLPFPTRSGAALVAVGDPGRDRTVYATILLLVALGFALIMLAVWLFRNTRPDPDVLAPLERMGERKWRGADPVWQHRNLDEVRPHEADPLEPSSAPPATDDDFERGPQPIGFDDLVASNTTSVDVASELPAPSADGLRADGPIEVGDGDVAAGGDDAVADEVHSEAAETVSDQEAAPDTDDDDEDITGEQDGDDFLAALDPAHEFDLDFDFDAAPAADPTADVVPDAGSEVEPDFDSGVDSDVDRDGDGEVETGTGVDAEIRPESDNDEDVVPG